jgi:MFS family permease
MTYLSEFRTEWRALAAGIVGMAVGLGYVSTTTSVFAPALLAEFGWSKAEFALTASLVLVLVIAIPLAGRLTDLLGVRRTALIGTLALPAVALAYTTMSGDIRHYLILYVIQIVLGATTTATVWCRILVDHFTRARGLALAIGASGATFSGFIVTPLLNELVDAYGWRVGYQALAAFIVVGGAIALLLVPKRRPEDSAARPKPRRTKEDYVAIARMPVFWLLAMAVFLCNLPMVLSLTQLKLLLQDNGMSGTIISFMLSIWSLGAIVGRFTCGLALDRYPTHVVAAIGMGLPAVGLLLIASPFNAPWLLILGLFLFGCAFGAEGDIVGYIVARVFGLGIFSTVLGLLSGMISGALAAGAALLGLTLHETGHYPLFLCIVSTTVLIGASMFLLLGRQWAMTGGTEPQMASA